MQKYFIHLADAWYAEANLNDRTDRLVDDVLISPDETTEIAVEWLKIDTGKEPYPCVRVFDDMWQNLFSNTELCSLFASLHGLGIQPQEFCETLLELGYVDATPAVKKK